ncbi:MAG: hypothetical protein WCX27_01870 [Candidatus Paceibacterota bacterium]|jgi:hypothetical protein
MKNLIYQNKILSIVVVILVAVGLYFIATGQDDVVKVANKAQNTPTTTSTQTTANKAATPSKTAVLNDGRCGLKVTYPVENSRVNFPLKVTGVIDNRSASKLGCAWNEINARAGTAQLFYFSGGVWQSNGIPVNILTSAGGTASTSAFSVNIDFLNAAVGLRSGAPMKITFIEQNSSVLRSLDMFDYYIYMK